MYYKHWYNELYEFKGFLHQVILLQCLFEVNNKDYTMINMLSHIQPWVSPSDIFIENVKDLICFDAMSDDQIHNERKEINTLIDQIDLSKFVFWDYNVQRFMKDKNLIISSDDTHPSVLGHKAIAKEVLLHDSN